MKILEVVAAIITRDSHFLCVQRGNHKRKEIAYRYEFAGGKIEKGESHSEALIREISEELQMQIEVSSHFLSVQHDYGTFKINLHSYFCSSSTKSPILQEHVAFKWLCKDQLMQVDWAPADLSIITKLRNSLVI